MVIVTFTDVIASGMYPAQVSDETGVYVKAYLKVFDNIHFFHTFVVFLVNNTCIFISCAFLNIGCLNCLKNGANWLNCKNRSEASVSAEK